MENLKLEDVLVDWKISVQDQNPSGAPPKNYNGVVQKELAKHQIIVGLETMVEKNTTTTACNLVNELKRRGVQCDPSFVFYECFMRGNIEIMGIFEDYSDLTDRNIQKGLLISIQHGQISTVNYALKKAQQRWGDNLREHLQAAQLITKFVDSHHFNKKQLHTMVEGLIPHLVKNHDLSFAVVRASMRQYKQTARVLLKHTDPQLVRAQIGDNHNHPHMQWLLDVLDQNQRSTLKRNIKAPSRTTRRKI